MGIRVQHQGAGAGAGIDDGFKRKYDMRIRQQEKVQDRMFQLGMQNRNVALQRENMIIGDNLQANQRRQARQDAQADLQKQQEFQVEQDAVNFDRQRNINRVAAVQGRLDKQKQADLDREEWNRRRNMTAEDARLEQERMARLNRAQITGDIETGIELGEFDEDTAKRLEQTFKDEEEIVGLDYPDEVQKDEALAKLHARRMRLAQRRRDPVSTLSPTTARQAFDMNPGLEDRLTKQAMEQLQTQYKMQTEARELDPTKPLPAMPTYEAALNMAGQMWDQRQKFGQQPAAGGTVNDVQRFVGPDGQPIPQSPPAYGDGISKPTGNATPNVALENSVSQDPAKEMTPQEKWQSMALPSVPDIDWSKLPKNDGFSNLQYHASNMDPETKKAFNYAMGSFNDKGTAEASQYLRSNGFDIALMGEIPQAPRVDWLSLVSSRPTEERSQFSAIRKFSESQPADIQNAIALVMNPKTTKEAKKNATAHLMNRGINLLEIQ